AFALEGALDELDKTRLDAVVVIGVHSDYDPARIHAPAAARRLLTTHPLDPLIPGGAAACPVISRSDHARSLRLPDPARIHALAAARRLFTTDRLDALIPGEAAACAVIMRSDHARSLRLPARARIHALATGHSKARPDNDESAFEAAGMTAVARAA